MTSEKTSQKWLLPSVKPILAVFLILIPARCSAVTVNCSQPNQPALLEALKPVFNLSSIRPVMNKMTLTNITAFFSLYGIIGVDEKAQLLKTFLWLEFVSTGISRLNVSVSDVGIMRWLNEFTIWDPIQCGADKISLPREMFWVPDIVINEFMEDDTAPKVPYLFLFSNGKIHDGHPAKVVSSCNLDIYTFPFDIQNCSLTFTSYIYSADEIDILLGDSADKITAQSRDLMTTMGEWELLGITVHKIQQEFERDKSFFNKLSFHIRLRRRATLYVLNLLIPSCFLITVDLFSFLLPPQSVDRSSFKMTLILGYTVFLFTMSDLLPVTGNTIPLINVFLCLCLALMVASLLETIFITNLVCCSTNFSPVPHWIRVLVLQMGCLVFLPQKPKEQGVADIKPSTVGAQYKADEGPPDERGPVAEDKALKELRSLGGDLQAIRLKLEQQLGGSQSSEDWIQVGLIIDRLMFSLYILFISVSFITISIIWVNSYSQ